MRPMSFRFPTTPRPGPAALAVTLALAMALVLATWAGAQDRSTGQRMQTSALIAEALDRPIELDLRNRFLRSSGDRETGVRRA